MEGKCTYILKSYKGELLMYKFTVYSLYRPPYNDQFQLLNEDLVDPDFGTKKVFGWDHQFDELIREIIIQNDHRANNQFIGDRWGI